ncbi:MAG: hypothetical protein SGI87_06275 [Flavobacteriales bacterium]|nr:hypothetical protein [Flavobacteriales bacterium]
MPRYRPAFGMYLGVLVCLASFLLINCSKHSDEAAVYNDSIVEHQEKIVVAFDALDSTLSDSSSVPTSIVDAHAALTHQIQNSVLALDSIGPFRKDPSLQKAARSLFTAYGRMAEDPYARLIHIRLLAPSSITQSTIDTSLSLHHQIKWLSEESQLSFLQEQTAFGKKYHLEFE